MENLARVRPVRTGHGHFCKSQYEILTNDGKFFQSYDDVVVFLPKNPNEKIILDENLWDSSPTTRMYREKFLNEDHEDTQSKMESGEYLKKNLNKPLT